jgi:hypothetical protein
MTEQKSHHRDQESQHLEALRSWWNQPKVLEFDRITLDHFFVLQPP